MQSSLIIKTRAVPERARCGAEAKRVEGLLSGRGGRIELANLYVDDIKVLKCPWLDVPEEKRAIRDLTK